MVTYVGTNIRSFHRLISFDFYGVLTKCAELQIVLLYSFYTHTVLTAMFTLLIYASYKNVFIDLHILWHSRNYRNDVNSNCGTIFMLQPV